MHIPHDPTKIQRPCWYLSADGYVSLVCPLCGQHATLRDSPTCPLRADGTRGHNIAADGTVTPSIICPNKPCTWHVWGKLLDWVP